MSASNEGQVPPRGGVDKEFLAFLVSDCSQVGLSPAEVAELGANRYLEIQKKLERLFAWRGCHEEDELARIALDRASRKWAENRASPGPGQTGQPNPVGYVCSFVRFVFLEWLAKQSPPAVPPIEKRSELEEKRLDCLDVCIKDLLEPGEQELILKYYQGDKGAKIDHRKELAKDRKTSLNALRLECYRIRRRLEACIVDCMDTKQNRGIAHS
jgi:hypothetical protein